MASRNGAAAPAAAAPPADQVEKIRQNLQRLGDKLDGQMGAELVAIFDELRGRKEDATFGPTMYYWQFGRHLAALAEREARLVAADGRPLAGYGCKALARALHETKSRVQLARYVVDAFPTEADLRALLERRKDNGEPLSWTVISVLCQPTIAPTAEERAALFDRARVENWTGNDVNRFARQLRGEPAPGAKVGGRPIHPPRDLHKAVAKWRRENQAWLNYGRAVFKAPVLDRVVADTDLTQDGAPMLKEVGRVKKQLQEMITLAQHELELLDRVEGHVRKRLDGPVSAPAAAEAPAAVARRAATKARRRLVAAGA